jgi:hypothetical protein
MPVGGSREQYNFPDKLQYNFPDKLQLFALPIPGHPDPEETVVSEELIFP